MIRRTKAYGIDILETCDFLTLQALTDKLNKFHSTETMFFCVLHNHPSLKQAMKELVSVNILGNGFAGVEWLKSAFVQPKFIHKFKEAKLSIWQISFTATSAHIIYNELFDTINRSPYNREIPI